jgi:hypothetical protein
MEYAIRGFPRKSRIFLWGTAFDPPRAGMSE